MKYLTFVVVVIGALFLTSSMNALKQSGSASQAVAFASLPALSANAADLKRPTTQELSTQHFDKAFDIKEGDTALFGGLSIKFAGLEATEDCEDYDCRQVVLNLSHGGSQDEVRMAEGGMIEWNGHTIKLSQAAPFENTGGVPYRVVVLVAKEA